MENQLKISICIPYYNASVYITDAITSIEQQTYTNWDVIIFNDGSTKEERNLLETQIIPIKNKAKIIDSHNIGLFAARCKMFDSARGDVIISLDSDDYFFDKKALEKIASKFLSKKCDMVIYNNTRNAKGSLNKDFSKLEENTNNIKKYFCCEDNLNNIWIKAYKKKLFNNFPVAKNTKLNMCEDIYMSTFLLDKTKNISIINEPLYFYRVNENSIVTKEFGKKRIEEQVFVEKNLCVFANKWNINEFSPAKHWFEFMAYGSLKFAYINFSKKERHSYYDLILKNDYTKEMLSTLTNKLTKQMPKHKSLITTNFIKRKYKKLDILFWMITRLSKLNS